MNATGGQVDFRYPQQEISEEVLCNCERKAEIKFTLRDAAGNELNCVRTSVGALTDLKAEMTEKQDVSF